MKEKIRELCRLYADSTEGAIELEKELLDLYNVSKPLLPEGVTIDSARSKEGMIFTDYEYREWLKSDIDDLDDFLEQELC